jgi:hypothetical protein
MKTTRDGHWYEMQNGEFAPGVTTIVDLLAKPAIIKWAYNLGKSGKDYGETMKSSQDRGSDVHDLVNQYLKGEKIISDNPRFLSFLDYWAKIPDAVVIATEKSLVSNKKKFGGTLDAVIKVDDHYIIIDWKTSKAVYSAHKIQIAAYRYLMFETERTEINDARIVLLGQTWSEYRMDQKELNRYWKVFKNLLAVYYLLKEKDHED